MDDLQRLIDIEAIRNLKGRYFRMLDTKQWEEWGMTFAEDATLEIDSGVSTWGGDPKTHIREQGREKIWTMVRASRHETVTVHHGHTAEIEITSPATATGIWAMEDIVIGADLHRRGQGHYHETYEKVDGRWYIKTLKLTRLNIHELSFTQPLGGNAKITA